MHKSAASAAEGLKVLRDLKLLRKNVLGTIPFYSSKWTRTPFEPEALLSALTVIGKRDRTRGRR
jgi:hypothetical protein